MTTEQNTTTTETTDPKGPTVYRIGDNFPGCLPEGDPFATLDYGRAVEILDETLDRLADDEAAHRDEEDGDEMGEAESARAALAAHKRDEPDGTPFSIGIEGRVYWIEADEPIDDDETRRAALAVLLECDLDDVEEAAYGENTFEAEGGEFLVLDDEEAQEAAEEAIERDLWAFRPEFLAAYCPDGVDSEVLSAIQEARCEDASEPFRGLVGDRLDDLKADAIGADGRGHFLAHYDHDERETDCGRFYVYRARRDGYPADRALRAARSLARFEDEEEAGRVRFRYVPDDDPAGVLDFLDAPEWRGAPARAVRDLADRDGVWVALAEVRRPSCPSCGAGERWDVAGSLGGLIGDPTTETGLPLDYRADLAEEARARLRLVRGRSSVDREAARESSRLRGIEAEALAEIELARPRAWGGGPPLVMGPRALLRPSLKKESQIGNERSGMRPDLGLIPGGDIRPLCPGGYRTAGEDSIPGREDSNRGLERRTRGLDPGTRAGTFVAHFRPWDWSLGRKMHIPLKSAPPRADTGVDWKRRQEQPTMTNTQETSLAPLVIDSFAGGGGASSGLAAVLGREVDVAVNHCPEALAMHRQNHPDTVHLEEDVWLACKDAQRVTQGRPVGVLWASPDCRHFSRARGGRPVSARVRSLAWTVVKWAKAVKPRIVFLENVPEFTDWGPIAADGKPIKARKGELFRRWCRRMEAEGYVLDWRVLDAADYGVPTHRRRLYLVARRDGQPIEWPEPTHGPGRGLPYRTAAECIDWSIPGRSIFGRKKPLADATMMRIAKGLRRYVLEAGDDAFIVRTGHARADGKTGMTMRGQRLCKPLGTVCAGVNDKALIIPWVVQAYGGGPNGKIPTGKSVAMPLPAITQNDHNWLAEAHVQKVAERTAGVDEVRAFLIKYYGNGVGQGLDEPLHTITQKDRFGIVEVHGVDYEIVDITLRMLEPHELAAAQGFPPDYVLLPTKKASVAKIGNSGRGMTPLEKFVLSIAKMDLVYAPNDPQNMTRTINAARRALQEEGARKQAEKDSREDASTRTITLRFEDATFRALRNAIGVRGLCAQAGGLPDAFVMRLVEEIEKGTTDWDVVQKGRAEFYWDRLEEHEQSRLARGLFLGTQPRDAWCAFIERRAVEDRIRRVSDAGVNFGRLAPRRGRARPETTMTVNCDECWGTGFWKGQGAPCSQGCKPKESRYGLDAGTSPAVDLASGRDETVVGEFQKGGLVDVHDPRLSRIGASFLPEQQFTPEWVKPKAPAPQPYLPQGLTINVSGPSDWELRDQNGPLITAAIAARQPSPNIHGYVRVVTVNQSNPWQVDARVADGDTEDHCKLAWVYKARHFICNAIDPNVEHRLGTPALMALADSLARRMAFVAAVNGLFDQRAAGGCNKSFADCQRHGNEVRFGGVRIPGPTPDTPCPFLFRDKHCGMP
ncbi:Modification methylase AgeI (M.AgeI) (Cytosine-specific methyltransferase AgeI) [Durusdinium trenchii]|uniref:DNA (cytosine-5-)-methyltransferase n=1 Tax=Durusdinium trenchii TaxID=1381693 RepID=A0ABP0PH25_9DINO